MSRKLVPSFSMNNQNGHWVCWMSTGLRVEKTVSVTRRHYYFNPANIVIVASIIFLSQKRVCSCKGVMNSFAIRVIR